MEPWWRCTQDLHRVLDASAASQVAEQLRGNMAGAGLERHGLEALKREQESRHAAELERLEAVHRRRLAARKASLERSEAELLEADQQARRQLIERRRRHQEEMQRLEAHSREQLETASAALRAEHTETLGRLKRQLEQSLTAMQAQVHSCRPGALAAPEAALEPAAGHAQAAMRSVSDMGARLPTQVRLNYHAWLVQMHFTGYGAFDRMCWCYRTGWKGACRNRRACATRTRLASPKVLWHSFKPAHVPATRPLLATI